MPDTDYMPVLALEELQDPGSRGVTVPCDNRLFDVFVVRRGDEVRAYLNNCPHTGAPLDWVPDQFLSLDSKHIQCAMHGALFRWNDGKCIAGPCAGDALTAVPARVENGQVMLGRAAFLRGQST